MKRKIAVIASSRATYGYKRRLISLINKSSELKLQLIVTGMHLMQKYGHSVREIETDNFPIAAKVDIELKGDTPFAWTKSIGIEIKKLSAVFNQLKPDIVLVTGDRAEMLAAAVTASYMNIPIAHIQAGDVSGHIDGSSRHAITKLSHIHFASCEDSAKRVERMGEEKWRIFNTGAPQLDDIIDAKKRTKTELSKILNINFNNPTILVIQHPVLVENREAAFQMRETMKAINSLKMQTIVIYPNIDAGGKIIIKVLEENKHLPYIYHFRNIEHGLFISLLSASSVIVGNSSCGILEAPTFKLPAVNIGNRQRGRMQAGNVINTEYNKNKIKKAIEKALFDKSFKNSLQKCVNPYGDGKSSQRIFEILKAIKINKKLLDKIITY